MGSDEPQYDCYSCGSEMADEVCSKSRATCGHHCNHSWTHDHCDWCGTSWGEGGAVIAAGEQVRADDHSRATE